MAGKHSISVMSPTTGHTTLEWDVEDTVSVEKARHLFDDVKAKGMIAYALDPGSTDRGEVIHKFNPQAERIVVTPQVAGG